MRNSQAIGSKIVIIGIIFLNMLIFSSNIAYLETNSGISVQTLQNFSFTLVNGSVTDIEAFKGKPILLEWGASWCSVCKANQKTLETLYPLYKDTVYFISLSIGTSGDSLDDVKNVQQRGPYMWLFGLDHTNVAKQYSLSTGTIWILDSSLNFVKTWNYTVVPSESIQKELNSLLPEGQQPSKIIKGNNTFLSLLLNNPLFIGVVLFSVLSIVVIIAFRFKKERIKTTQ